MSPGFVVVVVVVVVVGQNHRPSNASDDGKTAVREHVQPPSFRRAADRRSSLRRAGTGLLLFALASCGLVGVCEQPPDLGAAGPRIERPDGAPVERGAGSPMAWHGDAGSSGDAAKVDTTALVPGLAAYEKMNVFEKSGAVARSYERVSTAMRFRVYMISVICTSCGQRTVQK